MLRQNPTGVYANSPNSLQLRSTGTISEELFSSAARKRVAAPSRLLDRLGQLRNSNLATPRRYRRVFSESNAVLCGEPASFLITQSFATSTNLIAFGSALR